MISPHEPEQLMNNGFDGHFFCSKQGKTVGEIEPHLIAEYAFGSCSSAVGFRRAIL